MDVIGGITTRLTRFDPRLGALWEWNVGLRRRNPEYIVADHFVRPDNTVLDIGANRGLYTARFARRVGPSGTVHAFEPNPVLVERLNRVRAGRGNVHLHHVGLSDRDGAAALAVPVVGGESKDALGSLEHHAVQGEMVPVELRRLDDLVAGPVDFVKCDVEGHEAPCLRGGERLFSKLPTLMIEIMQSHHTDTVAEVFAYLAGLGYEGWAMFPDALRPLDAFSPAVHQPAGALPSIYMFLFVRPGTQLPVW